LLHYIGRQQRRQRVQITDRHAGFDGHARRSRELHTPLPNGGGLQGPDAPSVPTSTHPAQTLKVLINIPPKALGKLRPRQLREGLPRRLPEPAPRPTPDLSDIRIPRSDQSTPRRIVGGPPGLRPIALEALDDALVHLGRRNPARGTKPHK